MHYGYKLLTATQGYNCVGCWRIVGCWRMCVFSLAAQLCWVFIEQAAAFGRFPGTCTHALCPIAMGVQHAFVRAVLHLQQQVLTTTPSQMIPRLASLALRGPPQTRRAPMMQATANVSVVDVTVNCCLLAHAVLFSCGPSCCQHTPWGMGTYWVVLQHKQHVAVHGLDGIELPWGWSCADAAQSVRSAALLAV